MTASMGKSFDNHDLKFKPQEFETVKYPKRYKVSYAAH